MTPVEVERFFETVRAASPDTAMSISRRGESVVLKMSAPDSPLRWAQIVTPGERWFSLELNGGFVRDIVDEDATDDEARALMMELFRIGVSYMRGDYRVGRGRWLRVPAIIVPIREREVVISLSVGDIVRRFIGK